MRDSTDPQQPASPYRRRRPTDLQLLRDYVSTMLDPEFRPVFYVVVTLLTTGTIVYSLAERWSPLDSLYFCVVTLATIGYGDLHPTTDFTKAFTIVYVFLGVGTLGAFISAVSRASFRRSMERRHQVTGAPVPAPFDDDRNLDTIVRSESGAPAEPPELPGRTRS